MTQDLALSFSKFFHGLILAGIRIFLQILYVIDPDFIFVFGIGENAADKDTGTVIVNIVHRVSKLAIYQLVTDIYKSPK